MKKPLTQQAIADIAGVTRQTLSAWKRAGFDISESNLPAIQARAGAGKATGEIGRQLQEERLRKLRAEADRKEHDLLVETGKYVTRASAASDAAQAAVASVAAWQQIEDDLPPRLEGMTASQMKKELRDYARVKCLELSELFGTFS